MDNDLDITNSSGTADDNVGASATPADSNTVTPLENTTMPPITRPEDLVLDQNADASVTIPSAQSGILEQPDVVDTEVAGFPNDLAKESPDPTISQVSTPAVQEPGQVQPAYAPVPEIMAREPEAPVVSPIQQSSPNPAMVPDPLYAQASQSTVASSDSVEMMAKSPDSKKPKGPKQPVFGTKTKKALLYSGLGFLGLCLLVGGYLGVTAYLASRRAKIVQTAVANLVALPAMSSDITISLNDVPIGGKLKVDKDGNLSLVIDEEGLSTSLIYLDNKDAIYVESSDDTGVVPPRYSEYKNISNITELMAGSGITVPDPNLLSDQVGKVGKFRVVQKGSEVINGQSAYKMSLILSDSDLQTLTTGLISETIGTVYDVSISEFTLDFWIYKDSKLFARIDLEMAANLNLINDNNDFVSAYIYFPQLIDSAKVSWSQDFIYDYSEMVRLPIGSKIVSSTDVADFYSNTFGEGAQDKIADLQVEATISALLANVNLYRVDNGHYPETDNILELMAMLTPATGQSPLESYDVSQINYTYDKATDTYAFSFRLNNQESTGPNIVGLAPNKIYKVGNASN